MITKKDRQLLLHDFKEVFATKVELAQICEYFTQTFVTKDEFFTRFDLMMSELKTIREEMAAMHYRISEHTNQLEAHELRFQQLEASKTST